LRKTFVKLGQVSRKESEMKMKSGLDGLGAKGWRATVEVAPSLPLEVQCEVLRRLADVEQWVKSLPQGFIPAAAFSVKVEFVQREGE
jgi:hypothetical protein